MNFTVINGTEWTYPDVKSYKSGSDRASIYGARNSYCSFQVLLWNIAEGAPVSVVPYGELSGFDIEYYELVPAYVEEIRETPGSKSPYIPTRDAAFYVYDCAKPLGKELSPHGGTAGLYVAVKTATDAIPGTYRGGFEVQIGEETVEIETEMKIYAAQIPTADNLKMNNSYSVGIVAQYHDLEPGTP